MMKISLKLQFSALLLGSACILTAGIWHCADTDLSSFARRSQVLYGTDWQILAFAPSPDTRIRILTEPDQVDPLYLKMLLAAEDERFYSHPGVDVISAGRALISNVLKMRTVSGASTLAMQCVRLAEPRERTLKNKLIEAIKAVKLTHRLGRKGILQLYLTTAPFGSRLQGVQAASLFWFGHEASRLTPAEAALLVALPRAPERLRPDRFPERARAYRNEVLRRAVELNFIDATTAARAAAEDIPRHLPSLQELKQNRRLVAEAALQTALQIFAARPEQTEFHSYLQPELQRRLQQLAGTFADTYTSQPERDLAITVVDNSTHRIAGILGGRDSTLSELDLSERLRSPGSALKPFVYAMAFEERLLHPKTLLSDEDSGFHTYQPRNFSRTFTGEVTAADALTASLNIPAVKILSRLGPERVFSLLNRRHKRVVLPEHARPNLSLVLGGCAITLQDLTVLYSALATGGTLYEPELLQEPQSPSDATEQEHPAGVYMFSEHSAQQTLAVLTRTARPTGFTFTENVSYKTGTSYNSTDAWAIGSCGKYTIGVWTGLRSGKAMTGATGIRNAAPYLFELCSQLVPAGQQDAFSRRLRQYSQQLYAEPVPPALRYFEKKRTAAGPVITAGGHTVMTGAGTAENMVAGQNSRLQVVFPADKDELLVPDGDSIQVEVRGGTPPYMLFAADRCVSSSEDNTALQTADDSVLLSYTPDFVQGFVTLTVMDSAGEVRAVNVKISRSL